MLLVAVWLQPNAAGFGTHQQLGFRPCSFVRWFGVRCPTCGMTTAWAWTVRGNLFRAIESNVGGMLLALAAIVAAPWLVISAMKRRWIIFAPTERFIFRITLFAIVVSLLDWFVRRLT